jgi:hypothetical protein
VRPLASAIVEFRTRGLIHALVGVISGAVASVVQGPRVAIPALGLGAAIFGGLMHLTLYGPRTRQILEQVRPAPTSEREPASRTRARVLRNEGAPLLVVLVALSVIFRDFAVVSGITLGNGIAMTVVARRLAGWQRLNHARVWREPRYRWRGQASSGRGGGVIDPADYYFTAAD